MPIYVYECPNGHKTEMIRAYDDRLEPVPCHLCDAHASYTISAHHAQPDGIHSYAPNLGSEAEFERKTETIRRRKQDGGPWAVPKPEQNR